MNSVPIFHPDLHLSLSLALHRKEGDQSNAELSEAIINGPIVKFELLSGL